METIIFASVPEILMLARLVHKSFGHTLIQSFNSFIPEVPLTIMTIIVVHEPVNRLQHMQSIVEPLACKVCTLKDRKSI
jgi:hypothetical protein